VAALLHGIPQQGVNLGSPKAPVTLVEFADLQCPYCSLWERSAFPTIVTKYVRPGKVRMVFVGMTFVGPDSARLFRAALSAGLQNRFWNVAELLYLNQGKENTGWATDSFLRSIGRSVKGLDVAKMLAKRNSASVKTKLAAAASFASSAGIRGTPTFAVGRTNGSLRLVQVASLDAAGIEPALDDLLNG
jgi:protein-disulfide isomerase